MARYPERTYTHRYGDLIVSVKYEGDSYWATVRRPSDGYDVTIETFGSRSPIDAARYALRMLSEHPSSDPGESRSPITRARRVLGPDAKDALSDFEEELDPSRLREDEGDELEMNGKGKYDSPFPEEKPRKEGDVWFNVMQYSDDPKAWVAYPLSGKKFKTEQEARDALWHMLNEGFIKPGEKHLWGIERARQGRGPTEVYHVRVG